MPYAISGRLFYEMPLTAHQVIGTCYVHVGPEDNMALRPIEASCHRLSSLFWPLWPLPSSKLFAGPYTSARLEYHFQILSNPIMSHASEITSPINQWLEEVQCRTYRHSLIVYRRVCRLGLKISLAWRFETNNNIEWANLLSVSMLHFWAWPVACYQPSEVEKQRTVSTVKTDAGKSRMRTLGKAWDECRKFEKAMPWSDKLDTLSIAPNRNIFHRRLFSHHSLVLPPSS